MIETKTHLMCSTHGTYHYSYGTCPLCTGGVKTVNTQDVLSAIAALAAALTARDQQLSVLAGQISTMNSNQEGIEIIISQVNAQAGQALKSLNSISDVLLAIGSNQQKTNELFVAIDVRLKAIEKKLVKRGKR